MGAFDYLMTQTKNESYLSSFTPEQLEFFYAIPSWAVASWAIGVWGGVVGAILLLLKKSASEWIFLASVISVIVTTFQNYILSNGMEVMGGALGLIFTGIIFVIALGLYLYARAMHQKGLLT